MSKYVAHIDMIDRDYRSYIGSEQVDVDSWDQAQSYCESSSWGGVYYKVDFLKDTDTNRIYSSKSDIGNFMTEFTLLDVNNFEKEISVEKTDKGFFFALGSRGYATESLDLTAEQLKTLSDNLNKYIKEVIL